MINNITCHIYSNLGILGAIAANLKLGSGISFIPGIIALAFAVPGIIMFKQAAKKLI